MQEPKKLDQKDPKTNTKPSEIAQLAQESLKKDLNYTGERMLNTHEAPDNMPIKRKRGRPTKYKAIFCEQIISFFHRDHTFESKTSHTNKKGETWTSYETKANPVPLMCSFSEYLNVTVSTLFEWEQKHANFSKAISRAQELQLEHLAAVTGMGLYNSNWAVFMAKNISKWRDKKDIEHSGKVDSSIFINDMARKAAEAERDEADIFARN